MTVYQLLTLVIALGALCITIIFGLRAFILAFGAFVTTFIFGSLTVILTILNLLIKK